MAKFEIYNHHSDAVWVRSDLKGLHREHCLCYDCENFKPDDREKNCKIANLLYAVDCETGITSPVWECPKFIDKKE